MNNKAHRDVIVFNGNVDVNDHVSGSVVVLNCNRVNINSKVDGDVVVLNGKINILSEGEVGGNVVFSGNMDRKGIISGKQIVLFDKNYDFLKFDKELIFNGKLYFIIITFFITFIIGFLILIVFNKFFSTISLDMEDDLKKKFPIGIMVNLILLVLLLIIGILVLPVIVYYILITIANILVAILIGRKMVKSLRVEGSLYIEYLMGALLIFIIRIGILFLLPKYSIIMFLLLDFCIRVCFTSLGFGVWAVYLKLKTNIKKDII